MTAALIAPLLALLASPPAEFHVTAPAAVIDLDTGQLHGVPIQLAWSRDSQRWYVETIEGTDANAKHHRFEIAVGDTAPKPVDAAPEWAISYWNWKSGRAVPAHPSVLIAVEQGKRTGEIPTQSLREKAAGTSNPATAMRGAFEANNEFANAARVLTLTIDRTMISQLVDEPLVPGMTFGWSPKELDAVAFRNEHHHGLSIYRIGGGTLDIGDTREILLPAWSPDGTKIAFLEQTGKKKYTLQQVSVSLP